MKEVRRFYKEVVEAVCEELELDPVTAFSTNRERCVDARGADCVPAGQAHPGRSDKRTDRIDEAGCQQAQKHIPGANRA